MTQRPRACAPLDAGGIRAQIPLLATGGGRALAYLDNAATSHKPRVVLDAIGGFYAEANANVHRAGHTLALRATELFERARGTVQRFLGARSPREIVFVRGTTEAINLVAQAFARPRLRPGEAIVATELEHHSNLVPWQIVCQQTGAELRVVPIDARGDLQLDVLAAMLDSRVKLLTMCHVANALGTVNDVAAAATLAHERGIPLLVDGAQAVPHLPVDVGALGCDFYAFSGHKVFGPTGIGALWGRLELLAAMPPWQSGGEMIESVSYARAAFAPPPQRFEAGTPDIAGAVGLAAALGWLEGLGRDRVAAHDAALVALAQDRLAAIPSVRLVGAPRQRAGLVPFTVAGVDAHELAALLDQEGIAIRAGHHCAEPLHARLGLRATARASFAPYTTEADVERLAAAVERARAVLAAPG